MRWSLAIALLPLSLSGLHAQNIVIIDQPTSPAYIFDFPPAVAAVVPGMPIRIRAGIRSSAPPRSSIWFLCDPPATLKATLRLPGSGVETVLPLQRFQDSCEYYTRLPSDLPSGGEIFIRDSGRSGIIPNPANAEPQTYGPGQLRLVSTNISVLNRLEPAAPDMPARARDAERGNPVNLRLPAQPGSIVELSVIGYGSANLPQLSIQLGDDVVRVIEATPSGDDPSVHLLRFAIPAMPSYSGCSVPLVVRTGDVSSNLTTLPVADASGSCLHKLSLRDTEKATLDSGSTIPFGQLQLNSIQEGGGVIAPRFSIIQADARAVAEITGTDAPLRSDCRLSRNWTADRLRLFVTPYVPAEELNPGFVTVTSPAEQSYPISLNSQFMLSSGSWRLRVEGSAEVAAFEHTFRVAPAWLPEDSTSLFDLRQESDQQLLWNPSAFAPEDGVAFTLNDGYQNGITCRAPASVGQMTVPIPAFLTALSETSPPATFANWGYQTETSAAAPQVFRFPMIDGTEGVGVIRVTSAFNYTRGLTVE